MDLLELYDEIEAAIQHDVERARYVAAHLPELKAAAEARLAKRAASKAAAVIGRRLKARTGKNTTVTGTVTAARYERPAWRGNRVAAIFKLELCWTGSTGVTQYRVIETDRC